MKVFRIFWGGAILVLFSSSCKNRDENRIPVMELKSYPVQTLQLQEAELQSVFPATLRGEEDAM